MSEVYVRVRPATNGTTRELVAGQVLADFDPHGNLIGVEVLGAESVKIDGLTAVKLVSVPNVPQPFPDEGD